MDEISDFILDPERLEIALELETKIKDARFQVLESYWRNVQSHIQKNIESEKDGKWSLVFTMHASGRSTANELGLVMSEDSGSVAGDYKMRRGYSIVFQSLSDGAYLGIHRGLDCRKSGGDPVQEMEVRGALEARGLKRSELDWMRWEYVGTLLGLPDLSLIADSAIVTLNLDNREDGRLSRQAAELLWEIYEATKQQLEDLRVSNR